MWSCGVCDPFNLFLVIQGWCVSFKNVDKCGECSEYCDSKFGLIGDGYGVSGVCGLMGDSEMWNGDDSVDEL